MIFYGQDQLDAYRSTITVEAPDLTERVIYNERKWRVTSWYCPVVESKPDPEDKIASMIWDLDADVRAKREADATVKLRYSSREEATHVSLCGVSGAIVRIDQVQRTGEYCMPEDFRLQEIEQQMSFRVGSIRNEVGTIITNS